MAEKVSGPGKRMKAQPRAQLFSTEFVIDINEDLLIEILSRVPTKPLIRLKLVSKQWNSLISSPKFCLRHSRMNITTSVNGIFPKYISGRSNTNVRYVSFSKVGTSYPSLSLKGRYKIKTQHVSHGIALCSYNGETNFILCNFATGKYKKLPKRQDTFGIFDDCFLVFDPTKSFHYQVVVVNQILGNTMPFDSHPCYDKNGQKVYNDGRTYKFDIYSSETKAWKFLPFKGPFGTISGYKALWNREIHWITINNIHVRYSIDDEKLYADHVTPTGLIDVQTNRIGYLGDCDGRLLHVTKSYSTGTKIYEMDKDYGWTEKLVVDIPLYLKSSIPVLDRFVILCFLNRGNGNNLDLIFAVPGKTVSYSLGLGTFEVLQEFPDLKFPHSLVEYDNMYACPFVPTLYPVDHV